MQAWNSIATLSLSVRSLEASSPSSRSWLCHSQRRRRSQRVAVVSSREVSIGPSDAGLPSIRLTVWLDSCDAEDLYAQ